MHKKPRVGLIVDEGSLPRHIYDLFLLSKGSEHYEVGCLIIQSSSVLNNYSITKNPKNFIRTFGIERFISTITLNLISKLEEIIVKRRVKLRDFYKKFTLEDIDVPKIYIEPNISKSGFIYRFSEEDLDSIKKQDLDILVRFGSGILRGEILTVCKEGVISFHHANNDVNRGGPPAFWEVLNRESTTGFVIQILKDELDGGDVICKGKISTSFLYSLNRARLYKKSTPFMHKTLEMIFSKESRIHIYPKKPYDQKLYKIPSIFKQMQYLYRTGKYLSLKIIRKLLGRKFRWGIAYQFNNQWRDITLNKSKIIKNPKNRFLADPFLLKKNNKNYCFLEDFDYSLGKGVISVFEINKDGYQDLGVVLEEDFHLSYPYIFEDEGKIFMCPETHQSKDIRVYECIDFPLKWKLKEILISDVSAVDTNIFRKNGKWWLLTNIDSSNIGDHDSELHIYFSESLFSGNWIPHPLNPIIFDSERARNGGILFENNEVFRVFQKQGWDMYGKSLGVAHITSINEERYSEETLFEISPHFFPEAKGTHTYGANSDLTVIDFVSVERPK